MALVSPLVGALLSAFFVLIIGVFIEKHYVSIVSVVANILSLLVVFVTVDLSLAALAMLSVYLAIGIVAWRSELNQLYFLFGCKTYGSLVLVLTLNSAQLLSWSDWIVSHIPSLPAGEVTSIVVGWITIAALVNVVAWVLMRGEMLPELQ